MPTENKSTPFEREERYVVLKLNRLTEEETKHWRECQSSAKVDCVVVEHDWPEYKPVWQMIERRMTGASVPPQGDAQPVRVVTDKPCRLKGKNGGGLDLHPVGDRCIWCEGEGFDVEYTRPDTGEVERLHAENEALRKTLPNSTVELVTLRAQLAERDALFSALENSYLELQKNPGPGWVCAETVVRDIRRVFKSLSASAEPARTDL